MNANSNKNKYFQDNFNNHDVNTNNNNNNKKINSDYHNHLDPSSVSSSSTLSYKKRKLNFFKKQKKSTDNLLLYNNENINHNNQYERDQNEKKNFYQYNLNSYQYQYQNHRLKSTTQSALEYIQFKLSDLINPNRNKTFIDNLYAQFRPDSNKINLVYIPPLPQHNNNQHQNEHSYEKMAQSQSESSSSNLILLANQSFTNNFVNISVNNINNYSNDSNYSSTVYDTNKLLNEFYLNAAYMKNYKPNTNLLETAPMPRLLTSEIFLICFVISLWLISIIVCLRRYSLFLCFHKRDVPFYDASLINVKIGADESTTTQTRPMSPASNQNQHAISVTPILTNTNINENENLIKEDISFTASNNNSNFILNKSVTASTNFNNTISNDDKNSNITNYLGLENSSFQNSNQLLVRSQNVLCIKCNKLQTKHHNQHDCYKSLSNGYFNYSGSPKMGGFNFNKSSTQNSHLYTNNLNNQINKLNRNKLKFSSDYINKDYYFSNGVIYPNATSRTSSVLLSKVSNLNSSSISNSKTKLKSSTNNLNRVNNNNLVSMSPNYQTINRNDRSLSNKRALIRNKHFNLLSLDENALHLYRDSPNKLSQTLQQQKNLNSTIHESSIDVAEDELDENIILNTNTASNNNFNQNNNPSPKTSPKKTDYKLRTFATLATPHANFISLRSGTDSANSSWVKPGRSYDYDNCDCNEIFSSSSLQQSQFLQPPSMLNIPNKLTLNNSNNVVLPTSQRPINPISSLRRHMFVNSRRTAQTTLDGSNGLRFPGDSVNNERSYEMVNSMSIASNNQLANILASSPNEKSINNHFTYFHQPPQPLLEAPAIIDSSNTQQQSQSSLFTSNAPTNIETINECEDPNLLNPSWIPLIVRRTLLEMHERAVLSKSDSNIKSKYRSSNHLLHSPIVNKTNGSSTVTSSKFKSNRKKKPLSLQNSHDKTVFHSTASNRGSNYINNFYEELRQKFFQINLNSTKSTANTLSTNVSTNVFKQDSKLNSLDNPTQQTNLSMSSDKGLGKEGTQNNSNNSLHNDQKNDDDNKNNNNNNDSNIKNDKE